MNGFRPDRTNGSKIGRRLLLALLLMGPSCAGVPDLRPYSEAENNDYQRRASVVVVALVEGDELVGKPVAAPPHSMLQLHKVVVRVENVLQGAIPERTTRVYYYALANLNVGFRALIFHREPVQRVLWLRKDGDVYRTACDWQNCTVWISSGAHPGYRPDPGATLDQMLIDLTLTRGEGYVDEHQFAQELDQFVGRFGLDGYTIEKLRRLALTESSDLKGKACADLGIYDRDGIENHVRESARDSMRVAGCSKF